MNPTRRTNIAVYDRMLLAPGERVRGPAVIEELASVTLLNAGQSLEVDTYGMLHIRAV